MTWIASIVHLKERIIVFYRKNADWLSPVMKAAFSFLALMVLRILFPYPSMMAKTEVLLGISVIQAFVPTIVMFFSAFGLILAGLWKVSLDIFSLFMIIMIIYILAFARIDKKYVYIMLLTPILFQYKLEFMLPVVLGMIIGYGAILPCLGGIFLYFLSGYTDAAITVVNASEKAELGMGVQRIFDMISIDRYMLVVMVTFALIILLASCLEQLLYERTWRLALVAGNIALILIMLLGKLFFDYDLSMARLFLECVCSMIIGQVIMLFHGIGDVSRIEKVSFEDDEYIYYVKAVPKMKMTHKESYEKIIKSESEIEE